jgi:phosphate transport system permease protein
VAGFQPDQGAGHFGVAGMLVGTLLIALVAIVVALPIALAAALYISEYAPRQIKGILISLVDLMAAVPSLCYGLWGFYFLQDHLIGIAHWLSVYFGWIPLFHVTLPAGISDHDPTAPLTVYKSSSFCAGLVVAMMVTPLVCSLMREVFSQAPAGEREGAYALGATKWGMIRSVVLPFGYGGMIGATMLGLGRAFGETIGVYLIISQIFAIQPHILQNGGSSIAATIAELFGSASTANGIPALMACGLTLFVVTLGVNIGASAIIARTRSGAMSEV